MRNVLVIGAAKSGVAAANFLAQHGIEVTISDSKKEQELPLAANLEAKVTRQLGNQSEALLENVDTIVLSPGVPQTIPLLEAARKRNIPVISEIELAFRNLKGTVIAITGSNGKSTTTALIGEILKEAGSEPVVAGNIGAPLISSIDPSRERNYVIELSSFQLETVDQFQADIALLLNITPDHMDRYDSLDDYAAAKYRIFRNQTPECFAIVNADDVRTSNPPTKARIWSFSSLRSVEEGAYFDGESLVMNLGGAESRIARDSLHIQGAANVENALASWLAVRAAGIPDEAVKRAFERFQGLPHRMVVVRDIHGVRYINDSKGTNVDATLKSLEGMQDGRVLLILGGKDKEGEFNRLEDLVRKKVRTILTIGAAAPKVEKMLKGVTEIVSCQDMAGAIRYARGVARTGDTVLLSPACASFDQYNNFEERGRHFEELVREIE